MNSREKGVKTKSQMKFKSLSEFRKYIEKCIEGSLENEVFETIKNVELKHIKEDVLSVYSPKEYKRRSYDGIDDEDNTTQDKIKNGVLEIKNITKFNPEYESENTGLGLPVLIEYGHGESGYFYDYAASDDFTNPRPFTENTIQEIKDSQKHVKALELGFKRNRINTRR